MTCEQALAVPHLWTEGDTAPKLGTFTLPDGLLAADFTIELFLERPDGVVETIVATDLGGSQFEFAWLATTLIPGRNQRAQIKTTRISDSAVETPSTTLLIDVQERVE
jgi:hypothetical protein